MQISAPEGKRQVATESQSKTRVAIVFWEGHLSIAPSIVSAMQLLAQAGYQVDVLVRGADEELPPVGILPAGVRILKAEFAGRLSSDVARKGMKEKFGTAIASLSFLSFVLRKTRRGRYVAVFGVDAVGGACAELVASLKGIPFYHWSLELSFAHESRHPLKRILKWLERRAARRASWIVIQDHLRADAFLAENRPGHNRVLFVPNAPVGFTAARKSDYLHRTLGIPPDQLIVLHAGMIDPEVMALELAESVNSWPNPFCLVLHSNFWKSLDDPYIRRIVALESGRLFVSNQPVPTDELDTLISSAYIGIAAYRGGLGPNYDLIVSASGKIPYYLRNGIPVICSDLPGMREVLEKYRCGIAVKDLREIPDALITISSDYPAYRAGALECYRKKYEFASNFASVLKSLEPV